MTSPSLSDLRARAERHQDEIDRDTRFFTVAQLASRWGCSPNTIRMIDPTLLPFLNVGHGLLKVLRRYRPEDIYAYESAHRGGAR